MADDTVPEPDIECPLCGLLWHSETGEHSRMQCLLRRVAQLEERVKALEPDGK